MNITAESRAKAAATRAANKARPNGRHVVRSADKRYVAIPATRRSCMAAMCMECMGWESDPKDCTAPLCPLYPFRRRTLATHKGTQDGP